MRHCKCLPQMNFADFDSRITLAMSGLNLVLPTGLILQDLQFWASQMLENFASDGGFGDVLPTEDFFIVIADGEHAIERHLAADFALEALDPNRLAGLDTILLS